MTDQELRSLVRELAVLRADGEPVVSLYLDTHWSDEQQRERARVFVREEARRELDAHEAHPQRGALERTLARLVAAAGERAASGSEQTGRALAAFGCEALGLWRVLDLPRGCGSRLCTGMRPQLLPLARLLDDVEPALVAVVHASGARVYELALGGVVGEATIEGPVPRSWRTEGRELRPAVGRQALPGGAGAGAEGFQYERADKDQRRYKQAIERNLAAAAAFLAGRFDARACHVVLVGPRETTAAFERALPERVRERIIARRPEPAEATRDHGARDRLLEEALAALARKEREQEEWYVAQAIGQARRGGLAVLGPDEVIQAVNQRRVQRLILEDGFTGSGWLCRNCDAIGASHAERCSYCDGELAWVKELGEELASRVLAEDGEVEVVPRDARLHAYRGVAATLRQVRGGFGVDEGRAPAR